MNVKKLIGAAVTAAFLSTAAVNASANTIVAAPIQALSFADLTVGTIHIDSLSDLSGSLFAATSVTFFPGFSLTLDSVTFSAGSVGSLIGDLDGSAAGFVFHNVAAGNYLVKASGTLTPLSGQYSGLAVVGANYNVTAVPEPESYAMLLAGLGLMGTIARRRSKSKAV